jgi:hypothetical protein
MEKDKRNISWQNVMLIALVKRKLYDINKIPTVEEYFKQNPKPSL